MTATGTPDSGELFSPNSGSLFPIQLPGPDAGPAVNAMLQAWMRPQYAPWHTCGGAAPTIELADGQWHYNGGAAPTTKLANRGWTAADAVEAMLKGFSGTAAWMQGAGTPGSPGTPRAADAAQGDEAAAIEVLTVDKPDVVWRFSDRSSLYRMRLKPQRYWRRFARHTVLSPSRMTDVAAQLAGRKRSCLGDEWRSHLSGESGRGLPRNDQLRAARGFLWAAARLRLQDAASLAWRPVDAALKSRTASNLFVLVPTAMAARLILRYEGTLGVVNSAESISAIGGLLYGLVRVGRWWRDVKPPEPKARRAKEQ
jgi:hypothetical protein